MDQVETGIDPENKPIKGSNKVFMILFIIGCIIGAIAIIGNVCSSVMFLGAFESLGSSGEGGEAIGAAFGIMLAVIFAIPSGIASVIALVLTGLGIKWNKIAGSVALGVIGASVILLIASSIMCANMDSNSTASVLYGLRACLL